MKRFVLFVCFVCLSYAKEGVTEGTIPSQQELDRLVMTAGLHAAHEEYSESSDVYHNLFTLTGSYHFLKQAALMSVTGGDNNKAFRYAMQYQYMTKDVDDPHINRIIVQVHLYWGEYTNAAMIIEKMNATDPQVSNYLLLGNIYYTMNKFDFALKNYIAFYTSDVNSNVQRLEVLSNIVDIYLHKDTLGDAIPYIDKYISNTDNSISNFPFFDVYKRTGNISRLRDMLFARFKSDGTRNNALGIVSFFLSTQEYAKASEFVKSNKPVLGDMYGDVLLQIYISQSNFAKALDLSNKLYKDTNKSQYLGLSAIYRYELLIDKNKQNLQPIISDLKKLIKEEESILKKNDMSLGEENAFFYNFLGYILIDYDIDVEEGINYAGKAVAISPRTFEYIDSLAWGFYKLGDCKKAGETFELIPADVVEGADEMKAHKEAISACKDTD